LELYPENLREIWDKSYSFKSFKDELAVLNRERMNMSKLNNRQLDA
jgi:hypothetical protein